MINQSDDFHALATKILNGATLLYPTDTIWGLGCSAVNPAAIEKIYQIKQRDHAKSMLILVADTTMLLRFVPHPAAEALDLLLQPGRPTTVIFPAARNLPDNLLAADGSIGIRIPRHTFCQQLLHAMGEPLVSTSANFSGMPSPTRYADIDPELFRRVDVAIPSRPEDESDQTTGSRIVKLTTEGQIQIIRP